MIIRNFLLAIIVLSFSAWVAQSEPYLSIWNFVDHKRYGAFPEEEHVSLTYILGGNFMTRLMFMQHFKSILNYSDHFFRLYFIVDKENREDVNDLMNSWNITNCEWFFYNLTQYQDRVKWIPNSHYSKYYGLSKLLIPEILDENVGKVMYVDIDMVFRADIFYLWQKFRDFNKYQSLGMVENLSDYYLNKDGKKSVWPATGRGFNTGIIMMDLDKLREKDWRTKWRAVANKNLKIHGKTTMSDQDIFNAYIYDHPQEVKSLPCEYNFQLGTLTKSDQLCKEAPLALHFNSQNKTVRKNYVLYNAIRKEIDGIDGSELRRRRSVKRSSPDAPSPVEDECKKYLPIQNFRVLPNALGRLKKTAELCMVTQLSKDRLQSFLNNAKRWIFPISAAIYGNDQELNEIVDAVKALNRSDVILHMVFSEPETTYPINFLRNTALNHSDCENILIADADFMIYGDYQELLEQTRNITDKEVLIIPAFEAINDTNSDVSSFPDTKETVLLGYFKKRMQMFRALTWPSAHNATDILEWLCAEKVYTVNYDKNYEPYFILKKASCPLYDLRFGGYGWNKVTHVLELRMMNYKFSVSPSSFMIHQNHTASDSLLRWRQDSHYQKCLHSLKIAFVFETADRLNITLK